MLFDVITGILSAFFLVFSLLYPFRRTFKRLGNISRARFHCIAGALLVLTVLLHINVKLLAPCFSPGFAALVALILVAVTGVLKRRNRKSKFFHYSHIVFAVLFILAVLLHIVQQIMNLLIM
ncbi:hypothetical protein [Ethanoligenens harbinense]|uniref:Ferric reductase domain protein transmembrane component domain n=1 Tax=Ethanoligenens harbinense (strain DSM 18485 / JCM 12961 / CGMCC 1.5033 / YUAN-3) TaxID=663278 RepID=E6U4G1_ETHHY|nr:hypothetical protein [Ethanoligenens harbinense]ADU27768.1 Ferric reductase domain protein transmembrane component domain [Ethanoligenens harbinense YUAN-3]AVQ96791.1 hypothetical protein CXQ68_11595 [Ethanoligenens harbinense YUAN-3]AYF39453.1 hypothetical protein CXP51_11490 [Ethanoligenens harbinense]AYF42277.1 hypothetical protein CN246_12035 [Ethanoligenens harbinense]QCN93032.1 hypothetical protein DRA42_11630 [Ethanoligenens harbinense]